MISVRHSQALVYVLRHRHGQEWTPSEVMECVNSYNLLRYEVETVIAILVEVRRHENLQEANHVH